MTAPPQTGPGSNPASILGFRPTRADAVAVAFLLAALVLFFYPLIWQGRVLFFRDIATEIVPKKIFQARSGAQVLWNPLIYFGQPLAANPQEAAFYPPGLLFRLGDVISMLSLYVVLHFAAAMFFTYLLVRARSASVAASAFAAIAFAGGGFFLSCGNQIVMLNSVTWLPALLWALDRAMDRPRLALLAGLFWALQVLGGEAEIAALSGLIAAFYLAVRLREGGSARAAATALAVALVVAIGLSAVQWMLTLEYIPLSNRAAGYSAAEAGKWSLEPARLVSLLAPDRILDPNGRTDWVLGFRGLNPYLLSIYTGLLCVPLSGLGAMRRQGNLILFIVALLFLWISLGPDAGIYRLLHALPGFDLFRIPERCLLGFALLFPLLAAEGLDRLRDLPPGRRLEITGAVMVAASAALAALGLARPAADPLSQHLAMLAIARAHAWAVSFAGLGLALLLIGRGRARAAGPALVAFLLLDLFLAHRYVIPTTGRDFYSLAGNLSEQLPAGLRSSRGVVSPSTRPQDERVGFGQDPVEFFRRQRLQMGPFTGLEIGLHDAVALSSFYPIDQGRWFGLARPGGQAILRWSGVRWVLSPLKPLRILSDPLPRAYLIGRARVVANQEAGIGAASAPGFDPAREVLVETADAGTPGNETAALDSPRIIREDNQTVEVSAPGPGWLVLLDTYYPGWEARVNGRPAPILRANVFFRAVRMEAGTKTVVFRYRPWRFYAGAAVSLATLLAAGIAAAGFFRAGRLFIKQSDQV